MKAAKKREPVDISDVRLMQIGTFLGDGFTVGVNRELSYEEHAAFVSNLYRKQVESSTKKTPGSNGDGLVHLMQPEDQQKLELGLTIACTERCRFVYIERINGTMQKFKDFYRACQEQIATQNSTPAYSS